MSELDLLKALQALKKAEEESVADNYKPYEKQLEFLNSVSDVTIMLGGNRSGKSTVGSYEVMCHATGNYPSWWRGIRLVAPQEIWVVGVTSVRVRDTIQTKLFGKLGKLGTGMIPKKCIVQDSLIKKTGTPMAIDRIDIKHVNGGTCTIQFFSYDQGIEKFMGSSVSLIWLDEEPPENIYNECKMRVLDCMGTIIATFTPLQGVTPFYDSIMQDESIKKIWMSMDDAKHLNKEQIEKMLAGMSASERKARRHGVATIGAGKVFNFAEEEYTIDPFQIPEYWRRLGGFDVGLTHPTGALMAAIDDDSKTVYITNEYKVSGKTAIDHAAHLKHWGIKFMTDPSAFNRQIGTGQSVASMYQDEGLNLAKANNDVQASISEIRRLMGSGRLFIFNTCTELLKELRTYRTKITPNGAEVIVKTNDDLVDPLRYVCMGIEEHAERPARFQQKLHIKQFRAADPKVGY